MTRRLFKAELLNLLDKSIVVDLVVPYWILLGFLLRECVCVEIKRRNNKATVIVCSSTIALVHVASNAASKYGENKHGLKRWVDQRIAFPMMSKMNLGHDGVAENITVYIGFIEEIEELTSNLKCS